MNDLIVKQNEISTVPKDNGKAIAEARFMIAAAKEWPRDENKAALTIANACKRASLAEKAVYAFPRGGQMITGPSIRLAEVIAMAWTNLSYGIREIERTNTETLYEAFCHDLENNIKTTRTFSQKHVRYTKAKGNVAITDERDLYELIANQATRRLRACILEVIPADIIEDAIARCEKTLKTGSDQPLQDRAKQMVIAFAEIGVTQKMLEDRLQHKLDAINEVELLNLRKIYTSIKDGVSDRNAWFDFGSEIKDKLNKRFEEKTEEKKTGKDAKIKIKDKEIKGQDEPMIDPNQSSTHEINVDDKTMEEVKQSSSLYDTSKEDAEFFKKNKY